MDQRKSLKRIPKPANSKKIQTKRRMHKTLEIRPQISLVKTKDLNIPYLAVSYFIICRKGFADAASDIHKVLHEAEMEVEVKELKTKEKSRRGEKGAC